MSFTSKFIAVAAAVMLSGAALADQANGVAIEDAYARVSSPNAKVGAIFFEIDNHGAQDDRLIDAKSDIAARVELHTHKEGNDGVMQMLHVPEGFAVTAGGHHALKRGGDHVMLMGLHKGLRDGDEVALTLVFEKAGEIEVVVPVDLSRKGHAGHGEHKHSEHKHDDHKHDGHGDHSGHNH
ncbi:copper chaperone PCu(A)C [Epibacterium sp. SM1969]|uniref:Copper chaperone PCu(A)C n=1 Tax=Tritonibacter aquimaris TaxID=2663379 RepID=A0A844AV59_9RHOB|nr:copper chaperone PCu(A)C [Tritonibacter aquimaris]MQY43348.1 copper chaperone PCu(A)C [Tritonibacter aquimaris]